MLSVSVVIPVRNAACTLPACLAALERLDPAPLEILLVDNGSTDGSLPLVQAFAWKHLSTKTQILEVPRRGAAAARNAGIQIAKGDLIAFMDSDCAPDPHWLRHLTDPFSDPTVGAVAGRVVGAIQASTVELFSALYTLQSPNRPSRWKQWTPWGGGYHTANLAVRRAMLQEVGGFDESMMTGEDHDLCARLYERGAEIAFVSAARVAHYHRTTLAGMLRQAFGFGQGHADLLRRHTARGLWVDLPRHPVFWSRCPIRAWVNLASADKKVLAILALGALYGPLFFLLPIYGVWLAGSSRRRAREMVGSVSLSATLKLAGFLVLKSSAMTLGRWWGSVKYRVICL